MSPEARERIERMLELLRQPQSALLVSPDVLEQAPPGMLERVLDGQMSKLRVSAVLAPGSLVALDTSAPGVRGLAWQPVRRAFGVMQGEPADAVADTDALHDEPGEGER